MSRAYRRKRELKGLNKEKVLGYLKQWIIPVMIATPIVAVLFAYNNNYLPQSIEFFFHDNGNYLLIFVAVFVIAGLFSITFYFRSLGDYEEETRKSTRANITVWITFWISWSFYCAYLVINQIPMDMLLFILITAFALLPGGILFLITYDLRIKECIQNEEIKTESEKNNHPYTPYTPSTLETNIKDYSGAYGLVCIPAYFIFLLLIMAWHMWHMH